MIRSHVFYDSQGVVLPAVAFWNNFELEMSVVFEIVIPPFTCSAAEAWIPWGFKSSTGS